MSAGGRAPVGLIWAGLVLVFATSNGVPSSTSAVFEDNRYADSGGLATADADAQPPAAPTGLRITTRGIDTTPPTISLVTSISVTSSGATITWTTDEASDSQVDYGLTTAYGSASPLNASLVTSHTVTLNGLAQASAYHWRVRSRDGAGNLALSGDVTLITLDATPPTVSLSAPSGGSTVSGTVAVTATASDNVGVVGVQFKIDGASLGVEDTASPFSVSWNTVTATNGSHTLTAVARDAAGNIATATAVSVTVANDTTPPVLSVVTASAITSSGATINWATNEASNSQVNYGLTTGYGNSSALNASLVTAHAGVLSGLAAGTTYHYRVLSRDAAGNLATSGDFTFATPVGSSGIAALYPGDVGIEADARVVFVEKFDEASLTTMQGRWTDVLNATGMVFSTDVPPGSPLAHSLDIPWVGGGVNTGGHLYKLLTPGVDDTLYVRYYIKYPLLNTYTHTGIWMGGYNPPLGWPNPQAGIKPTGTDRFSGSAEPSNATNLFDHYDYWMGMHQSADGNYWGDLLLNNPNVKVTGGQWMCVEHMIKLNNPVTAANGEHEIWMNGVSVSHLGAGFPNGTWSGGIFTQNPSGAPFTGFQWRSTSSLNVNYIWLQNFSNDTSAGAQQDMKFAHVVAAKSYIGCLR